MIYILHIDTSTNNAIVAISGNGKLLVQKTNQEARNHAATINMMVADALYDANISLENIHSISTVGGPGSYTGLRIGLATAKGYCYAYDKPLILTNKLTLLTLQQVRLQQSTYEHYLTALVARQGEYFIAMYNNKEKELLPPQHISEIELINFLNNSAVTIHTTGLTEETKTLLKTNSFISNFNLSYLDIDFWSQYSLEKYNCNSFVILANAEPFYLKDVYTHKSL